MRSLVNFTSTGEGLNETSKDWVSFRLDANEQIGTGHFMRCRTLAERFIEQGYAVFFFMRFSNDNIAQMASAKNVHIVELSDDVPIGQSMNDGVGTEHEAWLGTSQTQDAASFIRRSQEMDLPPPKLIVVDHYALDARWEQAVSSFLKAPVLVLDDLCDREHECDFLLDTTFGRTPDQLGHLVPPTCDLMLGLEFALLRDEFAYQREQSLQRRLNTLSQTQIPKNVLISMGGADQNNVVLSILEAFSELSPSLRPKITVLIGAAYPHINGLINWIEKSDLDIQVERQSEAVSKLIAAADVGIGASGQSTWERCCLGLPTINVVLANNQRETSVNLSNIGALINAGDWHAHTPGKFAAKFLEPMMKGQLGLADIANRASQLCDGKGAHRVFDRLQYVLN